ncbi:MAG TPA: hypothetical protein VJC08_01915, partial [bacterium]|nr:hypothetical protein [bacterium]
MAAWIGDWISFRTAGLRIAQAPGGVKRYFILFYLLTLYCYLGSKGLDLSYRKSFFMTMTKIKSVTDDYPLPSPRIRWLGIIFFLILHAVGFIGTPLYVIYHGVNTADLV